MLSKDIKSNNIVGKKQYMQAYKQFFHTTDYRRMQIYNINWSHKDRAAMGMGSFKATIKKIGSNQKQEFSGTVLFQVNQHKNNLEVSEIFYSYDRN